jgi:hypothetical protein
VLGQGCVVGAKADSGLISSQASIHAKNAKHRFGRRFVNPSLAAGMIVQKEFEGCRLGMQRL